MIYQIIMLQKIIKGSKMIFFEENDPKTPKKHQNISKIVRFRKRPCAPGGSHFYSFTLSTYSPVFVFTLINSPSFTNKGTFTVAPVSTVAGLSVRVAVSPLTPGSL